VATKITEVARVTVILNARLKTITPEEVRTNNNLTITKTLGTLIREEITAKTEIKRVINTSRRRAINLQVVTAL